MAPLPPDTPPEIAIALDVVKSITTAGRCREDAALYEAATALLRAYLIASLPKPVPTR